MASLFNELTILAATVGGCLIYGRLAYGCWPWESHKVWYLTKDEIEYLRAVQHDQHNELDKVKDAFWLYRRAHPPKDEFWRQQSTSP